jgi:plasmid stabilization system protein ParE
MGQIEGLVMQLEFRPRALADLEDIRDYLLLHGEDGKAERVRQHLVQRFNALVRKPTLGVKTSRPDVRILSPQKYPYHIYFTVVGKSVVILHVRHTSRGEVKIEEL